MDAYAICTEGIYGAASEETSRAILLAHEYAHVAAWALVEAARRGSAHADLTAIVLCSPA